MGYCNECDTAHPDDMPCAGISSYAEIKELRADLARVTAERDDYRNRWEQTGCTRHHAMETATKLHESCRQQLEAAIQERDQWERAAIAQTKDAERANEAATRLGSELAGLDAMLDQEVAKSNRLTAERDAGVALARTVLHLVDPGDSDQATALRALRGWVERHLR